MQADLYQRELRLQEDEIYRLEDHLAEYQAILAETRCELEETKRQLAARPARGVDASVRSPSTGPALAPPTTPTPAAAPTARDASPIEPPEVEFVDPPKPKQPAASAIDAPPAFEPGEPPPFKATPPAGEAPKFEATEFDSPATPASSGDTTPAFEPDPLDEAAPQSSNSPAALRPPGEPAPLVLAAAAEPLPRDIAARPHVGGQVDGAKLEVLYEPAPGSLDGSVTIRLRPTSQGGPAAYAGPVSVLLVEAAASRGAERRNAVGPSTKDRRLARWDFDTNEVAEATRRAAEGGTLSLSMALPRALVGIGENNRLWVRLSHAGGRHTVVGAELRLEQQVATAKAAQSVRGGAKWRGAKSRS
jgi:hypothetical protein